MAAAGGRCPSHEGEMGVALSQDFPALSRKFPRKMYRNYKETSQLEARQEKSREFAALAGERKVRDFGDVGILW